MEQAREIALQRAPGTVDYSFDIRNDRGTITEVLVNAKDGSIVGVEEEDAQKEAEEKQREERKKASRRKRP